MKLLPLPAVVSWGDGKYFIGSDFKIVLDVNCGFQELHAAKLIKAEIEKFVCSYVTITKSSDRSIHGLYICKTKSKGEEYQLKITPGGAKLSGSSTGIFWGIQTLRQIVRQCGGIWQEVLIEDKPKFAVRGFFHDVTRGKVPTLETMKELVDRLAFYKINQLQLYVEHTFAFKGFSEVWTGKDPITAEDILELDEYCKERHVELVPALATFGHLYEVLKTKTWRKYCELDIDDTKPYSWYERMHHHTLDTSNEDSFKMIQNILEQYIPLFSSNKFNICCDETFDLGLGKSAKLAENVGRGKLYVDYLKKLISFLQEKGKKVMFWGDIILKDPEFICEIPKDTQCLYWNYEQDINENEIKTIKNSGMKFIVCPSVCGWNMMMNLFNGSYNNISKMVRLGFKYGADGVLNTDWGNYGHINFFANSMPGMAAGAALSWNPDDARDWSEIAKAYSIIEFGCENIVDILTELEKQQAGTWSEIVCFREAHLLKVNEAEYDSKNILKMDNKAAVNGYMRSLEIEKQLAALTCTDFRKEDLQEYICSAHGSALMNAACLAIKKYAYKCEDTYMPIKCGELAVQLELWFQHFSKLWRRRNSESELYRILETIQDLCRFLRSCKS